jgi:hypothetical protein
MAQSRVPGPICGSTKPQDINDGTVARTVNCPPGQQDAWHLREFRRRAGFVAQAFDIAGRNYIAQSVQRRAGADAYDVTKEIFWAMVPALGALVLTTLVGMIVGGGIAALVGGIGGALGTVIGGKVGYVVGIGLLSFMGVPYLLPFIVTKLGDVGDSMKCGILRAWHSAGGEAEIDVAAREMADAVGIFFTLLLEGLVLFLTEAASRNGAVKAMKLLRGSRLFRSCPRLERWLLLNFGRLRAKYVKFDFRVLAEGPPIEGTSIPRWIRIRVDQRVYHVERNDTKLDAQGQPIGPALKHLGEKSAAHAGPWAKLAQTDYPISALAAALEQAECVLIFQPPQPRAKPHVDGWELIIDTRPKAWRVFHALPTERPQW